MATMKNKSENAHTTRAGHKLAEQMARGNGSLGLPQIERGPKPSEEERFAAREIVSGAGDGARTRDPLLGKQMLYH